MNTPLSRRQILKSVSAAALLSAAPDALPRPTLHQEGTDTPNICLDITAPKGEGLWNEATVSWVKQLGVNHVSMVGPEIPWQESQIRTYVDRLKSAGLTLGNLMITGFINTLYGRPGRDAEIRQVQESIRAAGAAGVPVVEYNFYAHRLVEGYFAASGRAGTGWTAFDYARVKNLPPLPGEGAHSLEEMWSNISYFLKAVVPVAEQAGVRLALHPNDPPAPLSRGSEQIMGSLAGWKRLIEIVPSKANGITYDCGVTRELGEDPVEVCRYFGARDRINHVHFRNVRVQKPREEYTEVFLDEGQVDMCAVMKEFCAAEIPALDLPRAPAWACGGPICSGL